MEDTLVSYDRTLWRAWLEDVRPKALDLGKSLRSGTIGIVAALVVARYYGRMDTAANLAATAAAVLFASILLSMLAHAAWSWATAPRRVFYAQQSTITDLRSEVITANADRHSQSAPKIRPGNLGDALDELAEIANEGRALISPSWPAVSQWCTSALDCAQQCLRKRVLLTFEGTYKNYAEGSFSNTTQRAESCLRDCLRWLDQAKNRLKPEDVNPDFTVPVK
jgi:small-conductance mechanosensitive channel